MDPKFENNTGLEEEIKQIIKNRCDELELKSFDSTKELKDKEHEEKQELVRMKSEIEARRLLNQRELKQSSCITRSMSLT